MTPCTILSYNDVLKVYIQFTFTQKVKLFLRHSEYTTNTIEQNLPVSTVHIDYCLHIVALLTAWTHDAYVDLCIQVYSFVLVPLTGTYQPKGLLLYGHVPISAITPQSESKRAWGSVTMSFIVGNSYSYINTAYLSTRIVWKPGDVQYYSYIA